MEGRRAPNRNSHHRTFRFNFSHPDILSPGRHAGAGFFNIGLLHHLITTSSSIHSSWATRQKNSSLKRIVDKRPLPGWSVRRRAVARWVFLPIWAPGLLLGGGPIYLRLGRWGTFSGAAEGGFVVYLSAGIVQSRGWAQNSEIFEPVSAIVASSSSSLTPPSLVLCLSVFCLFADVPGKGTLIRLLYIPPSPPLSLSVSYLGFFGCRADGRMDRRIRTMGKTFLAR